MKHELQEIIAVVNNKGGVGKTTTVQSIAAGLVRRNHNLRVLVVDLDPQCNLSSLMGMKKEGLSTIYEAMCKQSGLPIYKCKNGVYAVPGSGQMENIEQHLPGGPSLREQMKSYTVLLSCLQDNNCIDMTGEGLKNIFDDFDYVIIDCPPALSKNTYNALVAASKVLIPVQMEALSVKGVDEIFSVMEEVKEFHMNDNLEMMGLLPVMVDERTNITKELRQLLGEKHGENVIPCRIRRCVKLVESQARGESVFEYAPYCSAGIDYEKAIKIMFNLK